MSGHSKWNNIKRKKEKTDGAKAKVFTKIGREISVAVRTGGPNPASNSKLADLIAKAKRMNVPNDNIQRIIKKAEGGDKTEYEAITYEGYGPGGVAVMVETLTDNRNRTAADLRHYFDKNGGNLGAMGCVGFLFSQKGVIDISLEDKDADEAMMDALDAGAEDFDAGEEAAEITTDPENYSAVVKAMEEKGYEILSDDLAMVPMTTTRLMIMGIDVKGKAVAVDSYEGGGQADVDKMVVDDANKTAGAADPNRDTITKVPVLDVLGSGGVCRHERIALAHYYGNGRENSCGEHRACRLDAAGRPAHRQIFALNMDAVGIVTDSNVGGVT